MSETFPILRKWKKMEDFGGELGLFVNCKDFSDVKFVFTDGVVFAHRVLLAARSQILYDIFQRSPQLLNFEIPLMGVSKMPFLRVMEFFYTGKTHIAMETVVSIYSIASQFGVEQLKSLCIASCVELIPVEQVGMLLASAEERGLREPQELFTQVLQGRLEQLLQESRVALAEESPHHEAALEKIPPQSVLGGFMNFFTGTGVDGNGERQKGYNHVPDSEETVSERFGAAFSHIVSSLTHLLGAERSTLFLYDEDSNELVSSVSVGEHEIRVPVTHGVVGTCYRSGKMINIPDAYKCSDFERSIDQQTGYQTRSILCCPIVSVTFGKVIGVLEVLNKKSGPFTKEDEQLLRTSTALVSRIIDRVIQEHSGDMRMRMSEVVLLPAQEFCGPAKPTLEAIEEVIGTPKPTKKAVLKTEKEIGKDGFGHFKLAKFSTDFVPYEGGEKPKKQRKKDCIPSEK